MLTIHPLPFRYAGKPEHPQLGVQSNRNLLSYEVGIRQGRGRRLERQPIARLQLAVLGMVTPCSPYSTCNIHKTHNKPKTETENRSVTHSQPSLSLPCTTIVSECLLFALCEALTLLHITLAVSMCQ